MGVLGEMFHFHRTSVMFFFPSKKLFLSTKPNAFCPSKHTHGSFARSPKKFSWTHSSPNSSLMSHHRHRARSDVGPFSALQDNLPAPGSQQKGLLQSRRLPGHLTYPPWLTPFCAHTRVCLCSLSSLTLLQLFRDQGVWPIKSKIVKWDFNLKLWL